MVAPPLVAIEDVTIDVVAPFLIAIEGVTIDVVAPPLVAIEDVTIDVVAPFLVVIEGVTIDVVAPLPFAIKGVHWARDGPTFVCKIDGCNALYTSKYNLVQHLRARHNVTMESSKLGCPSLLGRRAQRFKIM